MGEKWFKDGLRFKCLPGCTSCCAERGWMLFSLIEAGAAAEYLKTTVDRMIADHLLVELPRCYSARHTEMGACVFLKDDGCRIYPIRPIQCSTWPFWPEHICDADGWAQAGRRCPGVGIGPVHSCEEIEAACKLVQVGRELLGM